MNTPDRDDELSRKLADTLERSLDTLDSGTLLRLAQARRDVLQQRTRWRRAAIGVALAASVAAVAVVPWTLQQRAARADADLGYLTVDPQMLSDMDMLLVLGENDAGA